MGKYASPIVAFAIDTVPALNHDPFSRRIVIQREDGTREQFGSSPYDFNVFMTELISSCNVLPVEFGKKSRSTLVKADSRAAAPPPSEPPAPPPVAETEGVAEAVEASLGEGVEVVEEPKRTKKKTKKK